MIEHPYLQFLRFCLQEDCIIPEKAKYINWDRMLVWAKQQAIVGVIYQGILKAGKDLEIPSNTLMEWIGYAQLIEQQNRILNQYCIEASTMLKKKGFAPCILKGQGNAMMYPNPLLRTSGDIDVWVNCKNKNDVIGFANQHLTDVEIAYHHVGGVMCNGISVELHFFPGFTFHPLYNYRLKRYFERNKEKQFAHNIKLIDTENEICVPTVDFNIVYQLSHLFKHFISGGVGLRQMIDYYYLLKSDERGKMADESPILEYLGLRKFAGAVMYIMKEIFELEENYLIVPKNKKQGEFLLTSILEDGNFGQHAKFMQKRAGHSNHLIRYLIFTKHTLKRFSKYPIETMSEIIYRFVAYFMDKIHN